jgi:hypothetical protein
LRIITILSILTGYALTAILRFSVQMRMRMIKPKRHLTYQESQLCQNSPDNHHHWGKISRTETIIGKTIICKITRPCLYCKTKKIFRYPDRKPQYEGK